MSRVLGDVFQILNGNVGLGTTIPRQRLDIQDGNGIISGNLGIGTTDPQYAIDAVGDVNFTGILRQSGTPYVSSQWTTSSTDIYYSSGNVGIGTVQPNSKLHIFSSNASESLFKLDTFITTSLSNYPPVAFNSSSVVVSGQPYGNGTYTVSASSYYVAGNHYPYYVFDGVIKSAVSKWLSSSSKYNTSSGIYIGAAQTVHTGGTVYGEWLQLQLPTYIQPISYSIAQYSAEVFLNRTPYAWYLLGSSNASTWELLDTIDGYTTWDNDEFYTFNLSISTPYLYYRWVFNKIQPSNDGLLSINEMRLTTDSSIPISSIYSSVLIIQSSGNIGIGTTVPRELLDIRGGNAIVSGSVGVGTTIARQKLDIQGGSAIVSANIGIGTTSPLQSLHVQNKSYFVDNVGIGTTPTTKKLYVQGGTLLNGPLDVSNIGDTIQPMKVTGNSYGIAEFVDSSSVSALKISATRNVGIGTIIPLKTLHVIGDVLTTGTITASNLTVLGDTTILNTISSNTEQMVITNAGTGPALKVTQSGDNSVAEFYDNESGLALMIANNGNIGIGSTTPYNAIDINGNMYINGTISTNNNNIDAGSGTITAQRFSGIATQVLEDLVRGTYLIGDNYNGSMATTWAVDADSANTTNKVVVRDASGNFSAGTITATLSGTATQVSQDLNRGTYLIGDNYNGSLPTTWAVDADSANTANKVVVRDASGNFSAGTITADLSGTATQVSQDLSRGSYLIGDNYNGSMATTWSVDADSAAVANKIVVRDASGMIYAANVGVGTTSALYAVDVVGDVNFTGILRQSGTPYISSQWTTTGGDIYYNSGNVGVGTTAPLYAIDADGDINFTGILRQNGTPYVSSQWSTSGSAVYYNSGNVGIGVTNPMTELDVNGTIQTSNIRVLGRLTFGPNDQYNDIQVAPIRKIFYTDTDSQTEFILIKSGIYGGIASNIQVFVGHNLLSYYDDTIKDYNLSVSYGLSNTIYTVTLTEPVDYASIVDITVWPTILPSSSPQGNVQQTIIQNILWTETNGDIYYTNGNVGIGTTDTSLGKLVVEGNIVPSACNVYDLGSSNLRWRDLYLSGNTIDLGGTRISQDTSTGGIRILNRVGTDVDVKGANLYASTNIGIGTTLARHKLDVQGGDAIISGSIGIGTTLARHKLDVQGGDAIISGSIGIGTTVPRTALDIEGGNAIISGNVGIGTSAPYATLHVVGNILTTGTITASNISVIGDYVTLNTITSNTEQIVVTNAGTGPALKVTQTGIQPIAEFYDYESGLAMTIANNGNIGIGTAAPQYTLDVSGNINFTGSLTSNNIPYLGIGDSIPVGAILPYYSATISDPSYLICDGATYQRADYIELANALGVNPAATTFTVPDLRDKFLKGRSAADAVGATGGSATKTLTEANMPAHSHSGTTTSGEGAHTHTITDPGHSHTGSSAYQTQTQSGNGLVSGSGNPPVVSAGTIAATNTTGITINSANSAHTHTFATDTKGSGTAFDILPPYNVVIYVIKAKNNQYITPIRDGDYWTNVSDELIYQSGNVGIGTTAPQSLLDVNGNVNVSGLFSKNQELINKDPVDLGTAGWYIIGTFEGAAGSRMELKIFGASGYSAYDASPGGYILLTVSINDNTLGFIGNCSGTFSSYGGAPAITQFKLVQNGANRFSHKIYAYVEILTKHTLHATISKGSTFTEEFTSTTDPGSTSGTLQNALHVMSTVKKFVGIGTTSPTAVLHVQTVGVNQSQSIMRVDDNNSGTTPFIINDTGKVGIGTTNPQAPLHVNGAIKNKNPIFSYTYSGSLTSYTGEINAWNSLIYDTENGMVSNMRYTAKVAGYYFITATMRANSAGGGFRIRKNSNTYHGNSLTNPATEMHVSANAIVFLAVNDYVSLFAYGTIYSETNWSYFQGYMIG